MGVEDAVDIPDETPAPATEAAPVVETVNNTGVTVTTDEIAAAEADLRRLEERAKLADELERRPPINTIDHEQLAKSLKGAMEPFIPKPPSNKTYDSEDMLANFKNFRGGLDALIADKLEEFFQSKVSPYDQKLNQVFEALPQLYLRSQENPQYKLVDAEARRIAKEYGVNYWQAAQIAQKELAHKFQVQAQQAMPQTTSKPAVPKHLSSPDTRSSQAPEIDIDKGPADFDSIMRDLRAKYGNNI